MRIILKTAVICIILSVLSNAVVSQNQMKTEYSVEPDYHHIFFDTVEWSYPHGTIKNEDGTYSSWVSDSINFNKDTVHQCHQAKLFTEHQGDHYVKYCVAELQDDTLFLHFGELTASTFDNLKVIVTGNEFECRYWTRYVADRGDEDLRWTTTYQKLILNTDDFNYGQELRGYISFECVQEVNNPKYGEKPPVLIKFHGPFKLIISG